MTSATRPIDTRPLLLHAARVLMVALILVLIHIQYVRSLAKGRTRPVAMIDLPRLRSLFPTAARVAAPAAATGAQAVLDATGTALGYVLQTSPDSDHLVGFSGPINTLIAFAPDDRILGIEILSSGDTREHVAEVLRDEKFMSSFNGLTWAQAAQWQQPDAVSGATLTSLAIRESIIFRLSGGRPSLRFPDPLTPADALAWFPSATAVKQDPHQRSWWHVLDRHDKPLGTILRTAPDADNLIGYQGPTEALIGFDSDGRIVGVSLGKSYDNEPYVRYVREDRYFLKRFHGLTLEQLASLDRAEAGIEGVSGATMTSQAVARGLVAAAGRQHEPLAAVDRIRSVLAWSLRDLGTAAVVMLGLVIGLTSLRGRRRLRRGYQLLVIGYLGLVNGDMLSQAMLAGWARNGVPWSRTGGLVVLTVAALLVPLATHRNIYCTHLCPHGAAQQLLKNRLPWRFHLTRPIARLVRLLPAVLLGWCVVVATAQLPFSLVDIEPFDAWVFRVAGGATIAVASVGLVAALFMPMAYCRYGCPTGAMLNYLRLHAGSACWSARDWLALLFCAIGAMPLVMEFWGSGW